MNIYGDYAASIVHNHRSGELRDEARRDGLVRQAKSKAKGRREAGRKARAGSGRRARTA